MARNGLRYSIYAPITTENPGVPIVYGDPIVFNHPIEANVTYERADNPLHGGDTIAENDNSIVGGSLAFNNTHLTPVERAAMLGHVKKGIAPNDYYVESGSPSPAGGFWYITSEVENDVKKYYAYWVYKTQLSLSEDNAKTKAGNTEWQTPMVEGPIMGVFVDESGDPDFRAYQVFSTYAAAKAWVESLAGVLNGTVETPIATPGAGEVASGSTVVLASATEGATVYYTDDGEMPTAASTLYSEPIEIIAPVTIKAIAIKSGMNNSAVLTAAYTVAA